MQFIGPKSFLSLLETNHNLKQVNNLSNYFKCKKCASKHYRQMMAESYGFNLPRWKCNSSANPVRQVNKI